MKTKIIYSVSVLLLVLTGIIVFNLSSKNLKCEQITAKVLSYNNGQVTLQDNDNNIYTFNKSMDVQVGDNIVIEYTGLLDKDKQIQTGNITNYRVLSTTNNVPTIYNDNGIFSNYYTLAYDKLNEMTLDEKIGQLLLTRYSEEAKKDLKDYKFSGFVFYEKDFKDKTKQQVIDMIKTLQSDSNIPLLTAVDEEGGTFVRVSSNPNLKSENFKTPKELYNEGGFELIKGNTIEKSKLLSSLGLNLNLAPVVDIAEPDSYIYNRTLGEDAELTSKFAKTVIEASKGSGVSYTLKHFPGYGNNSDTHINSSVDNRTKEQIMANDILPFEAGIEAGAEAILVSHNIISDIDPNNPVSLSKNAIDILKDELKYKGVIITDDLDMQALNNIDNTTIKALLAGNDLIITTDYKTSINEIKESLNNGSITEELINERAFKVLAWKYYKGLMINNYK